MCLIFFSVRKHPKYKLVVAGNRDEFYNRKTAPAAFWSDHPDLLAGRDLEAMGTWLGVTRAGRISMLTNFRDPQNINPAAPSRGKLVSDFLIAETPAEDYIAEIAQVGKQFNGFNLLAGTQNELWYYSNYGTVPQQLRHGYYGISNHLLDTPWPKVEKGKQKLRRYLLEEEPDAEAIFALLYDAETAADDLLPNTGLPLDRERALSSMFIKTTGYGSRCSTVITVTYDDKLKFIERVFNTENFQYETNQFEFQIAPR